MAGVLQAALVQPGVQEIDHDLMLTSQHAPHGIGRIAASGRLPKSTGGRRGRGGNDRPADVVVKAVPSTRWPPPGNQMQCASGDVGASRAYRGIFAGPDGVDDLVGRDTVVSPGWSETG